MGVVFWYNSLKKYLRGSIFNSLIKQIKFAHIKTTHILYIYKLYPTFIQYDP
jgi:hypothetical protein